ncbi:hypothetical protein B0H11DRAFT_1700528 [Mycena galericulata]|nr:hypothetical protein B0H11DRAFT_1700528 [Mycena galericulata]
MDLLRQRTNLGPAFPDSVFTTSEIVLCDAPNISRKNLDTVFYGFEAIIVLGSYDWKERGGLVLWHNETVIPLRPGGGALFPAGTMRYSFVPVAAHERQYLFRQYCHASVLRWVDKGFRSDTEFEATASQEELAAWEAMRATRGSTSAKMFTKIDDIYVF